MCVNQGNGLLVLTHDNMKHKIEQAVGLSDD